MRWLWEALRSDKSSVALLRQLLWDWCIVSAPLTSQSWAGQIAQLRTALHPIIGAAWNADAEEFCEWSAEDAGQTSSQAAAGAKAPNCYRYDQNGRFVDIDVGTIHSAKGQTHTATLVLETYFKKHDLEDLLQWICGKQAGAGKGEGKERLERMRLIYTAMSRPSHLLCLSMRVSTVDANSRSALENLGWRVNELVGDDGAA